MNTIIQSRNTDTATKQYSHSSNSVLHKVQPPQYNTTKHQVTNIKPAAGMRQHNATIQDNAQHNSNSASHRHTHTHRLKSCGHLSHVGRHTQREPVAQHPILLHTQQKTIAAAVLPSTMQPARKQQHHAVSPAGVCVQTITSNKASGLSLLVRE